MIRDSTGYFLLIPTSMTIYEAENIQLEALVFNRSYLKNPNDDGVVLPVRHLLALMTHMSHSCSPWLGPCLRSFLLLPYVPIEHDVYWTSLIYDLQIQNADSEYV